MEIVAIDELTGYSWFYEDGWYYQKKGERLISKLSKKNFPNPFDVWQKKIESRMASTEQERAILRPRKYIFDIWEHKNATDNN